MPAAADIDSYSSSAGKPRGVLKAWLDSSLPIGLHKRVRPTHRGVIDGEHDATDAQRVDRCVHGPNLIAMGL